MTEGKHSKKLNFLAVTITLRLNMLHTSVNCSVMYSAVC